MKFRNYHATLDALPAREEKIATGWRARIIKLLPNTYLSDMEKLCATGSPESCKQFANSLKDDCEQLKVRVSTPFVPILSQHNHPVICL